MRAESSQLNKAVKSDAIDSAAKAPFTLALGPQMTMLLAPALALALATQSPSGPELCAGVENRIVEDMRILESDLTKAAAEEAARKLQTMVARGEVTDEFAFGALNQTKIVHGHILLRQAQSDREAFGRKSIEFKESESSFCNWLVTKGFWHD